MPAEPLSYIVVGAGAAGCTVAGRLAEDGHHRVLLIEAGPPDRSPAFHVPGLGFLVTATAKYDWNLVTEPVPALNQRRLALFAGRVLGGSSSINGMQYSRGHSSGYDQWQAMGCEGWAFRDVLPYFKRAEANARGADQWHGDAGPLRVRPARPDLPICDAFLAAAAARGYPVVDDINRDQPEAFALSDLNIHDGRRVSAAVAYLRGSRLPNLQLLTGAQVLRVVIEHGRAVGVEVAQGGVVRTIRCEREVIVCAGGVRSPHLLMLSGVGPAAHLRSHGIAVAVDSPSVGRNFQNHACYRMQYSCAPGTTAYRHVHPLRAAKAVGLYALRRRGALAESYVAAGAFLRTDPSLPVADAQITLSAALVTFPAMGKPKPWQLLPSQDGISMTVNQGTPFSRGEITLRSKDPAQQPRICANYFDDPRDMDVLAAAVERVRELMDAAPIRSLVREELRPGRTAADRAALVSEIRANAGNSYHPAGACAMGGGEDSVVDPQLKVRGVRGLRVADASVIPLLPNAGLHAPTIMVGEKAAAMILTDAAR